ncbi:MAG: hypothetical protein GDA36_12030 [Rhodobacteraceae bacterium]|nr:hypothetical protein [Paracoccaceae bacterium]
MFPGGVQGWFDVSVFARFVSNADLINADDVLSKIDALIDRAVAPPKLERETGSPSTRKHRQSHKTRPSKPLCSM